MSEPYLGEIKMFAGNFAPRGWAECDGQLLSIAQNTALFSLLGTFYGGDGRTNFGLPDMQGRLPIHQGQGPGLTNRPIGQKSGVETVTLTVNQIPSHTHVVSASGERATENSPTGQALARAEAPLYTSGGGSNVTLSSASITNSGGSQPHTNMMPYRCIYFIIALTGVFPSRS